MVDRLRRGPASVSELAKPLPMTLSAVSQHLRVLEEAGLVRTGKSGRVRTCALDNDAMASVEHWIAGRKRSIEEQYDQLEIHLAHPPRPETDNGCH